MSKKKILIINQHFSTGGIKRSLENLLPVLMERYDVRVMALCGSMKEFNEKYPNMMIASPFILSSAMTSLDELRGMNLFILRFVIKVLSFILGKILDSEKFILYLARLCRRLDGYDCVIVYSHDNWFANKSFFGGANEIALKRVQAEKKISWIHGEPHTIGLTKERALRIYALFDDVITVSQACKNEFENLTEGKITCKVIHNLYNVDEILESAESCKNIERKESIFHIVTVARLSKIAKRVDRINEIAKRLKDSGYKFFWTVVGGGSEYDDCIRISQEYGLDDCVHYVGNQDNPYSYMKYSDVFVLVSDTEAMPMVINEAMIVGTPVITTNFPAAFEAISNGVNGFIVERDVNAIYAKIAFCIENRSMLVACREYIKKHPINNEKSIEQVIELIED